MPKSIGFLYVYTPAVTDEQTETKGGSCQKRLRDGGRRTEGENYFNQVCVYRFSVSQLFILDDESVTFLLSQEGQLSYGDFICF